MGNLETVRLMTPGQFKDLSAAVTQQIPTNLTFDRANQILGKKDWIGEEIARILRGSELPAEVIADWQGFWKKHGIEADFSNLVLPDYEKGFDRILVVPGGITQNQLWAICREKFDGKTWSYWGDDLDTAIPTHDRVPTSSYAIRVRDRVEADEELKSMSANNLSKRKIAGITLPEWFIYELKYHDETGEHLDISNLTLCSGSRNSGGFVPNVCWRDDRLLVGWYAPDGSDGPLRARAIVS